MCGFFRIALFYLEDSVQQLLLMVSEPLDLHLRYLTACVFLVEPPDGVRIGKSSCLWTLHRFPSQAQEAVGGGDAYASFGNRDHI